MTPTPENLVLELLRAICATLDRHSQEFQDIKLRLDRLAEQAARIQRQLEAKRLD